MYNNQAIKKELGASEISGTPNSCMTLTPGIYPDFYREGLGFNFFFKFSSSASRNSSV